MQIVSPIERYCSLVLSFVVQDANSHRGHGFTRAFRHFGAMGLFVLAILDSSPLPTFAGTDILTAILAATHRNPWYEYAAVATAGSVIGAYLTFRVARRVGLAYLERNFQYKALSTMFGLFQTWGSGALVLSTALPLPFPICGDSSHRRLLWTPFRSRAASSGGVLEMAAAVLRRSVQHCHRRHSAKPKICGGIESVKGFPQVFLFCFCQNLQKNVSMYPCYPLQPYQPNCFAWSLELLNDNGDLHTNGRPAQNLLG
jgi:membrane protein YqaA with SNARE-associated domain